MQEEIEVKKQLDSLRDRVSFLRDWIHFLTAEEMSPVKRFEIHDKIYNLKSEVNHKEYLIKMRENDAKMWENQRTAISKEVNEKMGSVIKDLRTKILPDPKSTKIADGIIKRFAKGKYDSMEAKIQDYIMGKQLLK